MKVSRWALAAVALSVPLSIGAVVASPSVAGAATTDITSSGPLTDIGISTDLNCSVNHSGDTSGEWFGNTACGTLLASAGTLYGPASIPAGGSASPRTAWTPVSQTAVTGSGTTSSPYKVVTVAAAGTSGLQVTETDSYIVGQESYRDDVTVTNTGATSASSALYRGGDCYLQNSDFGYGTYDSATGAITCTTSLTPGSRIEQMLPLTAGSNYFEGFYNTLWGNIGTQNQLPNTCDCSIDEDNSIGLSWGVSLGAGASRTFSSVVTFSPLGVEPVSLTKTADAGSVPAGGTDGYTITATNPNAGPVTLATLTDTLGAGFSYRSGTTTGATTANPSISGQTLTWSGVVVPGGGTASVHFGVTVATTPNTYTDDAEGTATGVTVAGTGPAAPVTVTSTGGGTQPKLDTIATGYHAYAAGSVSTSHVSTTGGGELLVALIQADGAANATQTVTSVTGAGLTWTRTSWADLLGAGSSEVWQAWAPTKLTNATVAAAFAHPADGLISVESFTGAAHQLGAVRIGSAVGGPAHATVTPTSTNSLVIAGGLDWSTATKPVPVAGQSLITWFVDRTVNDYYWTQSVTAATTAGQLNAP